MKSFTKAIIYEHLENMAINDFYQWLLEYLTKDINDQDRDNTRLEILRFVAEEGLI